MSTNVPLQYVLTFRKLESLDISNNSIPLIPPQLVSLSPETLIPGEQAE